MEDIEALVSSFETVDSGHQLHMQPVIMQASTPVEAQINFENSTKVIFKNIHHQSIRKVLSSGMVATDELSAMSGVPRTFRMKKVYFNSFNSSNIICSLFTQILPPGNYYHHQLPDELKVSEMVYIESENGMDLCVGEEKDKAILDCSPGTMRVSIDEREFTSVKYDVAKSQLHKHLQVVITLAFHRRVQIPNRDGNGWRDM